MYQKGMSLIEVMVAVFILASGLLGLGALQAHALQFNDSASKRSIAADLATDLGERIRANRSPFMTDSGAIPLPPFPPDFSLCTLAAGVVTCAAQSTGPPYRETYKLGNLDAQNEMRTWYTTLSNQLPGASYALITDAGLATNYPYTLKYTLTITWSDNRGNITGTDGASFAYVAVIE